MNYISTRNNNLRMSAAQAIVKGLAPDGGLMTPCVIPTLPSSALHSLADMNYQQRVLYIIGRFLTGFSTVELNQYINAAYAKEKFSHPDVAPIHRIDECTHCLELWHGPTCAFKDMALQMLPHLLSASLEKTLEKRTACILTATSGDTGKAALEGFKDVNKTCILVFYPKNGVSDIQELQMITQEGENVDVCAVEGNFDDAQTGVKKLFADKELEERLTQRGYLLSSANSINWGRVLPQIVYYVSAYCDLIKQGTISAGDMVNFCVPTGNFGNILAAYYAKQMGVPIQRLICASNSNNVLTEFIETGVYDRNRKFHNTISPSMDILISSNLERLIFEISNHDDAMVRGCMNSLGETGRYEVTPFVKNQIQKVFSAGCCTDEQTKETIGTVWKEHGYLIDPHTAVAFHVLQQYRDHTGDMTPSVVVSTASPFKFCAAVLDALGISELKHGTDILDQLAQVTGEEVPTPLACLKKKERRFHTVTEKEHMMDQVLNMLR